MNWPYPKIENVVLVPMLARKVSTVQQQPMEGGKVIYISDDLIQQVEYLINQSKQGNHLLFDTATVRSVYEQTGNADIADQEAYSVEHHLEKIIEKPSLDEKRAYLAALDPKTHHLVVRTYFNIVENDLFENSQERH